MFQRDGESNTEKYEEMMKKMFGSRSGNAAPNLQGISLHSDRGYWTVELVYDKLLRWGADLHGTVARTPWFPFTFSKMRPMEGDTPNDPHGRTIIQMKGYKDAQYKTLTWNHSKIRATAYNSGTGTAVSLAMSTIHHFPVFDLNLAFPKDHKYYFDPRETCNSRESRAFPLVDGIIDHLHLITHLPIRPLTTVQGDTGWFIMRQFSLTSSTVDPMISARATEVIPSMAVRAAYEIILRVVDRTNLLPDEPPEEEEIDEEATTPNEGRATNTDEASVWMRQVNEEDDGPDNFVAAIPTLSVDVLRAIIAKHRHSKPDSSLTSMKKQLEKWARCESEIHRKYHWYSKLELISVLKHKDPRLKSSASQKSKPVLLNQLVDTERRQQRRASLTRNGDDAFAITNDLDPVLLRGFMAWYMKKLKDAAKKYCREGHAMEIPFLREFHQHSTDGITCGYKSIAIHETPLVASTQIKGALDSSDAELVYEHEDGTIGVIPVELKARLAHSTFYDERNQLEANLGFQAWENGDPVYVELDAESEDFNKWIPKHKESFQLLHHVAVRNLRKGLIIVGNRRKIMFGVFVNYKDETIHAYREVLRDLYGRVLKEFYEDELQLPQEAIMKVIQSQEMKPIGLSAHSFMTSYFIWKRLRVDGCLPLPLPPCNRILPYTHSHWNNIKGASDTATKLFWNCRVMTSTWGTSQMVALGKYFQLFSVVLHRWWQISTAKTDLNFYASLHHFRNSRNRHWPYRKVLDSLREYLIKQANDASLPVQDIEAVPNVSENDTPSTPPRTARNNPRNPFAESRNYVSITGGTPKKGRQRFPKTACPEWKADQHRLSICKGQIFKLADEKHQKCFICNTKTTYVCLGCKRFYCFVKSRDNKIADMIRNENKGVEFLDGVRPPAQLDIAGYCSVVNSCYHIQHAKAWRQQEQTMPRRPLASIQEQSN
jgi:hypothetical protein